MRTKFLRAYGVLLAAILTTSAFGQSLACKQKSFPVKVNGGEISNMALERDWNWPWTPTKTMEDGLYVFRQSDQMSTGVTP